MNSNEGFEFWATFPTHVPDLDKNFNLSLANISVFITGTQASSGKIYAGEYSADFIVTPNSVTEVKVPRVAAYINENESGNVLPHRAIHIVVDPGKPKIVVFAHIFAGQRSAASLILPKDALGQQYYSMNFKQYDNEGKNFITIIATEPDTKVFIKRGDVDLVAGGITLNNVNDVYEFLSDEDLSGASVTVDPVTSGCKRFAMFSGSTGVYITKNGCEPRSIDPLYQQCYPVESWGRSYGYIPFSTKSPNFSEPVRTTGQYVRILAKEDNTTISINGATVITLGPGQFYTTPQPLPQAAYISANKPISVAQYALSQSCSNLAPQNGNIAVNYSDPDMVILNSLSFSINNITVYSSVRENITEQYVNVLIKTASSQSFKVNGVAPSAAFTPMNILPGYSYLQLDLNNYVNKTFTLTADEGFNAIAYGFGNVESYAYSAGSNLATSYSINVVKTATNQIVDTACVNDDIVFKLTLPFPSPKITWKMDENEAAVVQVMPIPEIVIENEQTIYVYSLPKTPAYQNPGTHQIKIDADYPNTIGGCNTGSQHVERSFYSMPLPQPSFTFTPQICQNVIDLNDTSVDPGKTIVAWLWDLGDAANTTNNSSTLQYPSHVYPSPGEYTVRLTVTSSTGCRSSVTNTIKISRSINLDMSVSAPNCPGKPVYFTDASQTKEFVTSKWQWYFGDGKDITVYNKEPVPHSYGRPGKYNVKLVLIDGAGCESDTLRRVITITSPALPDIQLPLACVSDIVHFVDKTVYKDDTDKPLSYLWDFGDPHADAKNPNTSTDQNPTHTYSNAQAYTISLTVTTANGCDTTITRQFFINGSEPKADFKILNDEKTCVNQPLLLTNRSFVLGFGSITKQEWYFTANGQTSKFVVDDVVPDSTYVFLPQFDDIVGSATCEVKLLAFSGDACVDSKIAYVTLLASPKVKLDTLGPLCMNSSPIQLTQGSELTGTSGDGGKYYVDGKQVIGLLDPSRLSPGSHILKYKFTSLGGCADSTSQQLLIMDRPTVILPDKVYVLAGENIKLQPKYQGNKLTYKWQPSTNISSDTVRYPTVNPINDAVYTVMVSNGACVSSAAISIIVLFPPLIHNTFTPNADGINDIWDIPNLNTYPEATVEIFNRYGIPVFYSIGYPKPWDGKYHGANVPTGTYYYTIHLYKGSRPLTGFVAVIR